MTLSHSDFFLDVTQNILKFIQDFSGFEKDHAINIRLLCFVSIFYLLLVLSYSRTRSVNYFTPPLGLFANTPKAVLNLFNQYFASVFINSAISNRVNDYESAGNCTSDWEYIGLSDIRLTDNEVEVVL